MTNIRPVTAFAVVQMPGTPEAVRRLQLTDSAQNQLAEMIESQLPRFIDQEVERVSFDPTYSTHDGSVLAIEGYALPDYVLDALNIADELPAFSASEGFQRVKAIFYTAPDSNVFFQCWRNFDVFAQGKRWFLLTDDTFDVEPKSPLVVENRLDAIYWNGDLLFKSYANTSSMLDMLNYVSDATDGDMQAFVEHELLMGDLNALNERCSKWHRKHIRLLVQNQVLDGQSVQDLYDRACEVDYELPVHDGRIMIPLGGRALNDLLHFLNDRIYRGPISGDTFMANSARRRESD